MMAPAIHLSADDLRDARKCSELSLIARIFWEEPRGANSMVYNLVRHVLTMLPLRTRLLDFTQFAQLVFFCLGIPFALPPTPNPSSPLFFLV
ncbi:hypothetical protein LINPERHAP1_LOCUS8993 [Linum perenne]